MINRIEYIDEERIAIYIGQSIFEADIETETRYDSEPSSFNGLNDRTKYEMYEYEYYKPYNLMRIEGRCNQTDKDVLEELEYKLNK